MRRLGLGVLVSVLFGLSVASPGHGIELGDDGELVVSGDFRLRLESDWNSHRTDGSKRMDRTRARARARVALDWRTSNALSVGLRLRTGSDASHQSPHITLVDFDDNDTGDADFNFDKWFLKASAQDLWGWAGRNSFPFWKQNELFWDDDVTPAGLAGGWTCEAADGDRFKVNVGYFSLPVGMRAFAGNLGAAQVVSTLDRSNTALTLAAGFYGFTSNPNDNDARVLRTGNGLRDYAIWVASGQATLRAAARPLTLGVDYMHNAERYSPADPYAFTNRRENDGFVVSAQWGATTTRGEWLLGYWYADVGALAVNASFAQDDWVRWGSATETEASDLRGHELRFSYGLGSAGNIVARLYLVEAITSQQDGTRFRIDYNVKF